MILLFCIQVDKLKSRRILLHITRVLTKGVVGGQQNWTTAKAKVESVDTQALFDKMDRIRQGLETPAPDSLTYQIAGSGQKLETNTEVEIKQSSYMGDQYSVYEMEDAIESSSGFNFEDPAQWTEYYRKLRQIEKEVQDGGGWDKFQDVFMISALDGHGVWNLKVGLSEWL